MKTTKKDEIAERMQVSQVRSLTGKVVSTAMTKTVIVEVVHSVRHPIYKKAVKRTKRFAAHYEGAQPLHIGDTVTIVETRAISKTKHFKVKENV